MNICIITSSFPLNPNDARAAAGLFVKDFALAVAERGHRVTVMTPDKRPGQKQEPAGLSVRWFPWLGGTKPLSSMRPYLPGDAVAMASLVREGRRAMQRLAECNPPDHILAMWAVPAGYLAMGVKHRHGIPFTTWCLGSDIWVYGKYPILKGVVARVLRRSDLIFADGLQLAEDAARLAGRPCSFLASSRRLNRSQVRPVEWPFSGPRFLFLGRYAPVKGVDLLLEAMSEFVRQGQNGHLHMLGGGPSDEFVRWRAERTDLKDRVTVGGYADDETAVSYLYACDCVVIPSRMESIPVVFSDAVQMGKPLIVTDVGDMGRLLRWHPAGLVTPPENSQALCRAMMTMARQDRTMYIPHIEQLARQFDVSRTADEWLRQAEGLTRLGGAGSP
jgi:glycosyltransferase involved in cell wall biosynthesis